MDNTAIAYDFTFYGSGQQNHFTLAEEDLVESSELPNLEQPAWSAR